MNKAKRNNVYVVCRWNDSHIFNDGLETMQTIAVYDSKDQMFENFPDLKKDTVETDLSYYTVELNKNWK